MQCKGFLPRFFSYKGPILNLIFSRMTFAFCYLHVFASTSTTGAYSFTMPLVEGLWHFGLRKQTSRKDELNANENEIYICTSYW